MRILMTTDGVGGVWQYSLSLARGLVQNHGCRLLLACMGEPPEMPEIEALPVEGVELVTLPIRLEWMPHGLEDVGPGLRQVEELIRRWQPDVVHSNQFCFGLLRHELPTVVVAHSDVLSWRLWHRGETVFAHDLLDPGLRGYRDLVATGLEGASVVVCPSHFMARSLQEIYGRASRVIYNGLWPDLYSVRPKRDVALVVGRLWDEAKGVATAVAAAEGLPVALYLLGPTVGPTGETAWLPAAPNARYLGSQGWRQTRAALSEARYYLATSSYEPFGLAALEAALSGCALLAADTAFHREVWGESALYFRQGDSADLRRHLHSLLQNCEAVNRLGATVRERALELYTAERMSREYYSLYRSLIHDRT